MKINAEKYPNAARFLRERPGWTIDQAITYLEQFEALI